MDAICQSIHNVFQSPHVSRQILPFVKCIEIGCCVRCACRFLHVGQRYVYTATDEQWRIVLPELLQQAVAAGAAADVLTLNQPRDAKCIACFNIFSIISASDFPQTVLHEIAAQRHEFTDYYVAVATPQSILIRTTAIWLFLLRTFGDNFRSTDVPLHKGVMDLKDLARERIVSILTEAFPNTNYAATNTCEFQIRVEFRHDGDENDWRFQAAAQAQQGRRSAAQRRSTKMNKFAPSTERCSIVVLTAFMKGANYDKYVEFGCGIPQPVTEPVTFTLVCERYSIFIAGRYFKYSRDVSQTEFIVKGERIGNSSVDDAIAKVVFPFFDADDKVFLSAGREDMDVRMLGSGRPFVIELVNARRITCTPEDCARLQLQINQSEDVGVQQLQMVAKEFVAQVKAGETTKRKLYRCVVWTSRALTQNDYQTINAIRDLTLDQKTPIRVLHRRSLAIRKKLIEYAHSDRINPHFLVLDLRTSAGTYVKEFVHGDLGRTTPNLGGILGCAADILQLDVMDVDMLLPSQRLAAGLSAMESAAEMAAAANESDSNG
eukprot:TRINITY_DN10691_c0_g1_i1.p1 TRINITY_DN10691_c0_g1~~TRINITY_DN10691_c0_g1_i1.p1  ORF type:complete len:547 (-),score=96.15 TRINITY_DN10691_c0_g1_i1:831-2471(-)